MTEPDLLHVSHVLCHGAMAQRERTCPTSPAPFRSFPTAATVNRAQDSSAYIDRMAFSNVCNERGLPASVGRAFSIGDRGSFPRGRQKDTS